MIQITAKEASTSAPGLLRLRRKAVPDDYFIRCTLMPGETAASFEEVPLAEVPEEPFDQMTREE